MNNLTRTSFKIDSGELFVLDQRKLPQEELWVKASDPQVMCELIKSLAVRGAPLIGVAAALALGLNAKRVSREVWLNNAKILRSARPTAVNLMHAVDRLTKISPEGEAWSEMVAVEAEKIALEDIDLCLRLAQKGASLINDGDQIITHCNAGALATAGVGTALGVITEAARQGKHIHVFVDETRPLLQGARLTCWELNKNNIPHTLICDNMAAYLMQTKKINKIFIGADRIAANGDAANKIGSLGLAISAKYFGVPFYVVAPSTTLDMSCPDGSKILVEERDPQEVSQGKSPKNTPCWNPAFDIIPRNLITDIILA